MKNTEGAVFISYLILAVKTGLAIISALLAWNWSGPESFIGVIGFLFLWAILSYIGKLLLIGVVVFIADR